MEDQNQNQLPMLPDPLENQPVSLPTPVAPAPVESLATNLSAGQAGQQPLVPNHKPRRNFWRIGLIFGGAIVVLLLILFGPRLAELLNLRGSKAGESIILDGTNFMDGSTSDPAGAFSVLGGVGAGPVGNGRLMLLRPPETP